MSKQLDTGAKLTENSVLLPSECFGGTVNKSVLFGAINMEQAAAQMPVLSSHDPNVMYMPMDAVYPSNVSKKNVFFGTAERMLDNVETCKLDSLHVFAVIISKTSLLPEYAAIYQSVYPTLNMAAVFEGTKKSVMSSTCSKLDGFENTLLNSKKLTAELAPNDDPEILISEMETLIDDDEVIVLFATEGYYMEMAANSTPICLRQYKPPAGEHDLIDGVKIIKGLELKGADERHEDDPEAFKQLKLGNVEYRLRRSNVVFQDLADVMCMTQFPPSFTEWLEAKNNGAGRIKSCEFYCLVFGRDGPSNTKGGSQPGDASTIRLACLVQKIMQDGCDLSAVADITLVAEKQHLIYINGMVGYKSAMHLNCPLIASGDGKSVIIKEQISDASPWEKLTRSSCHKSLTMSVHALNIIVALTKSLKSLTVKCTSCGEYCARNVCSAMFNNQLVSMVQYDESKSEKTGMGLTTLVVRNKDCSFIGDVAHKDSTETGEGEDNKSSFAKKNFWQSSYKAAMEVAQKVWTNSATDTPLDRLEKLDKCIANLPDLRYREPGQINQHVLTERFISNKILGTLYIVVTKSQIASQEALIQLIMKGNVSWGAEPAQVMGGCLGPYIKKEHVNSIKISLWSCGKYTKVNMLPGMTSVVSSRKIKHMQTWVKSDRPGNAATETVVEKCGLSSVGEVEESVVKTVSEWTGQTVEAMTEFLTDKQEIYEVVRSVTRSGQNVTSLDKFADVYMAHSMLYYAGFIQNPYGKNKYGIQGLVRHRVINHKWLDCNKLSRNPNKAKSLVFEQNCQFDSELNDSALAIVFTRGIANKRLTKTQGMSDVYSMKLGKMTANREPILMVGSYSTISKHSVYAVVLSGNSSPTTQFQIGEFWNSWKDLPTEREKLVALRNSAMFVRKAIIMKIGCEETNLPETFDIIDSYVLNSTDGYVEFLTPKTVNMIEHIINLGRTESIGEFLIKADELVVTEPELEPEQDTGSRKRQRSSDSSSGKGPSKAKKTKTNDTEDKDLASMFE